METKGNTTTFDHVEHARYTLDKKPEKKEATLIVVLFDGDPEEWFVRSGHKIEQALKELHEYYQRDWKGTNRVIPIRVYDLSGTDAINCL